jgi:alkylated DNA repair dioxygenase AlkB
MTIVATGRFIFSGNPSHALPVPAALTPLFEWTKSNVFPQLNGILMNWYEGPGHYIGPHHDSTKRMIPAAPIVTISFGEKRTFRLSSDDEAGKVTRNFPATDGTVFVIPYATNEVWKHSVPKSTKYKGRRISVTIRAFSVVD